MLKVPMQKQSSFRPTDRPIFVYTLQITVVTTAANKITHAEEEVLKANSV